MNLDLLDGYRPLHATAVAVTYSDGADLAAFVAHAHRDKLQVIVLPPTGSGAENPYPHPLSQIAAEASAAGADVLCISWLDSDPDPDYWQGQIAQVRHGFSGRILLAALPDLLPGIEFFDRVDLVGAIGPIDLGVRRASATHPLALHDLRTAWAGTLDSLESLCFRYGKQLVLLNITIPPPPSSRRLNAGTNDKFIPLAYEALLAETKGRLGTGGLLLNWGDAKSGNAADAEVTTINHYPDLLAELNGLWAPSAAPAATTAKDEAEDADSEPE